MTAYWVVYLVPLLGVLSPFALRGSPDDSVAVHRHGRPHSSVSGRSRHGLAGYFISVQHAVDSATGPSGYEPLYVLITGCWRRAASACISSTRFALRCSCSVLLCSQPVTTPMAGAYGSGSVSRNYRRAEQHPPVRRVGLAVYRTAASGKGRIKNVRITHDCRGGVSRSALACLLSPRKGAAGPR